MGKPVGFAPRHTAEPVSSAMNRRSGASPAPENWNHGAAAFRVHDVQTASCPWGKGVVRGTLCTRPPTPAKVDQPLPAAEWPCCTPNTLTWAWQIARCGRGPMGGFCLRARLAQKPPIPMPDGNPTPAKTKMGFGPKTRGHEGGATCCYSWGRRQAHGRPYPWDGGSKNRADDLFSSNRSHTICTRLDK